MNSDNINDIVNKFVRDNLSPKPEQRDYISEKYDELKIFLGGACFRTGSYARYTAIDPVHDLDVIYPVKDGNVQHNPAQLLRALQAKLTLLYKNSTTQIKEISVQTHSVTIVLADSPEGDFSIDVVPAIELLELNQFGQPFYNVPEILRMNRHNRKLRYDMEAKNPIGWIKSDPRGYVSAARKLNEANNDFRHTAKLIKGWRHACKEVYGDEYKLKSFHLEQIVHLYFEHNPKSTTVEAIINCLAALPEYMKRPQIADRADSERMIDEYISALSESELKIIVELRSQAQIVANQLPRCRDASEIIATLTSLITVSKSESPAPQPRVVTPQQPWAY